MIVLPMNVQAAINYVHALVSDLILSSLKKSPQPVTQLMGGSASSHSSMAAECIMNVLGIMHSLKMTEMAGHGVARVKSLIIPIKPPTIGVIAEMDAPFQVGNFPSS